MSEPVIPDRSPVQPAPVVGDWVETYPHSPLYEVLHIENGRALLRDNFAGPVTIARLADLTVIAHEDAE